MDPSPEHPLSTRRAMSHHRHRIHKLLPLRHTSFKWPERLKPGPDVQDDVAPPDSRLHQSVFSLIATAGTKGTESKVSTQTLGSVSENEQDSGSDTEEESKIPEIPKQEDVVIPTSLPIEKPQFSMGTETTLPKSSRARVRGRALDDQDAMTQSMILDPKYKEKAEKVSLDMSVPNLPSSASRATPILDEMVRVRALSVHQNTDVAEPPTISVEEEVPGSELRDRLNEIFDFGQPEDVVAEYPCWLLQSVLLQGYMWVTSGHVCFYAYLPRRDDSLVKSGYLTKRGKTSAKWNRRWMILNGDRLAYYPSYSDLYFPAGAISLRSGISANLIESKDKTKESTEFNLVTRTRTHYFRADSAASAKEWVKILQKVIFRSHNDGDSVKISLPIANVMEIEESPVVNLMETFRLRVVDNDNTYAIDDYFFSFGHRGQECYKLLKERMDSSPTKRRSMDLLSPERALSGHPKLEDLNLKDSVRATLDVQATSPSPRENRKTAEWAKDLRASVRRSIDFSRSSRTPSAERPEVDYRRSFDDRGRRSTSMNRSQVISGERSPSAGPSESLQQSDLSEHFSGSSPTAPTASQILTSDAIFDTSGMMTSPSRPEPPKSASHVPKHQTHQRLKSLPDHPDAMRKYTASPAMRTLVQAGQYPIKAASGLAGYIRRGSQKVSSSLASESRGYVEKVSGYWAGSGKHYVDNPASAGLDEGEEPLSADDIERHTARFRAHFALPEDEKLLATYFAYIHKVLPLYGKIYISNRNFCFRSLLPGTKTLLILPLDSIENVQKEKGFQFGYSGLVIAIRAHEEVFFEFSHCDTRDDCCVTLLTGIEERGWSNEPAEDDGASADESDAAKAEHKALMGARLMKSTADASTLSQTSPLGSSVAFDDPLASIINFKPPQSLRITCLTIGSRGDVQPYIALCKGLLAEGHHPRIATHREFESWVRSHGIDFAPVEGDPAELMRICVENGMFTYNFLKEASATFRGWIDDLLRSAWTACQETDILIESPSAMAGIHIAEALKIPYFRAFTMPWTRTRAYPHAFAVPERKIGGAYNYLTYVMFDTLFWTAIAGQVNRWRKTCLGIDSTNLDKLHPNKVPFLYNFSPSVVAPPLDYSDWIRVTGYWFLDEGSAYEPPKELLDFIAKAREDKKKLVYIGFGSIVVSDPAALTRTVVDSVLKADVRCILSKGWSDRLGNKDANEVEVPLPADIFQIKSAPHDWLFKQIDAAAHHGGAGTTGASLRMGLPTIIKPFFGDQFFFGGRVEDLGVGICMKKLNVSVFSRALWEATHSERMIVKARLLGEQIRKEQGVAVAIKAIYRDLEYAKSLIKQPKVAGEVEIPDEESWTFVGDESDMEMLRRPANLEQPATRS